MKIAMIGQDIPVLLPTLLTDLLFAGKEPDAEIAVEEGNPAMREVLQGYGDAVIRHAGIGGTLRVTGDRGEALSGADCVIYAGDPQAASRFFMDRNALGSDDEDNPGLTDQARVNGGIGGRGYKCLGLGRTPMKGANGAETYAKRLQIKEENLTAVTAGLPGFAFLTEIRDGKADMLPKLKKAAERGELGSLSKRWLGWWDAIPAGDVTDHAEFLPAQPDFIPEEKPEFGESVEKRKERILYMNTVREQGAEAREGAMAQLLLLSKAPPIRPMRLALAVLRKETEEIPAVARRNGKEMPQLPEGAVVETPLRLVNGEEIPHGIRVPEALAEVLTEVDEANRLAAKAAMGDPGALREYVETDPALGGLDRLYCLDVVKALVRLHEDVLSDSEE